MEMIHMSLDEAESVIYSPEFFNIQRMYTLARKNGENALKEAEQNLRHSIRTNFEIKRSIEDESSSDEEEVEDLFLNVTPNHRGNFTNFLSRGCYSKPNSPTFSETQESRSNSPEMLNRKLSLTSERNSPIHALTENTKRFRYPTLPYKSGPLYRTTNQFLPHLNLIWPASNRNHLSLKTPNETRSFENTRINQLTKQNSLPAPIKQMSLMYGSTSILNSPDVAGIRYRSQQNLSGNTPRLQRFTRQLTAQGPLVNKPLIRTAMMSKNKGGNYWTISNPLGNVRKNISSGFEPEGRLNYYIVGTTNDT